MMDDFAVVSDTPQMLPPPPGSFLDREELIQHVGEFGVTQGYIVTIKQSKKDKIVVLGCQRGGVYRNRRKSADEGTGELVRKRKSGSQLTNCPFELVGKKDDDFWVLSVKNGSHNHEPLSDITQHPSARRFTENEVLLIKEMTDAGLKPRQILKRLKQHNPERLSTPKQLYNIKTKIRQGNLTGSARRFKTLRPQTSAQGNPSSSTTSEPSWRQRYPLKVPNFIGGMFIDSQSRTSIDVLSPKIHARTASTSEIHEQPATGIDEYEPDSRDVLSSHIGSHRLCSTSNVVCTPFGHGHARPPSPSIDEYAMDEGTSSHHGYSHRPYGMAVDIQRPRAMIDAYGADERNTTTNQNQNMRHVKNSTINGLSSKVGEQTWQTTEEEEFEWEDMSPTLAGHGHAFGANRSMPKKNDFSRTNWSNQEMLPSVVLNNAVSSDSSIFENLRVMVVEHMIYLIHLKGVAGLINSAINKEYELRYVDLQHNPPQMVTEIERSFVGAQFLSLQKLFSAVFCGNVDSTSNVRVPDANNQPSSDVIDLCHLMQDTLVTLPTLNGWLLGYPMVYIFGKDHIEDAVYNLSTKSLHLFSIFVRRNSSSSKRPPEEELMSFSVPYDLSIDGENEAWAEAFLARMKARWEGCKHVWGSMRMEVSATYPQAIAL